MPAPRKPLLCRLNMHHKWVRQFSPDGEDYLHCKACSSASTKSSTAATTSAFTGSVRVRMGSR